MSNEEKLNCFLCDEEIFKDDDCCCNCGFPVYDSDSKEYKLYIVACSIEDVNTKKEVEKLLKGIYKNKTNILRANHLIMQWGDFEDKDDFLADDAIDLIVEYYRMENRIPMNMNVIESINKKKLIENAMENIEIFKQPILETIDDVKDFIDKLTNYDEMAQILGSKIERKYFKTVYNMIYQFSETSFKYIAYVNFAFYEAFSYTDEALMKKVYSLLDDYFKIRNQILEVLYATYN